ncbi:DUF2854 domain-containing protein [Aphanothece sacrum]|uniref:DUF2854 domain-containing protein n=1 Tax=Aphanothece sacrum FPU1 TaxID=1920663 RepID=A0A401ICY6_APHSA|nr:DUF2854 domain-containing protein [Aphanothece sacrum]GBF79147.1 hypothetical protein AsFPU1_0539 [Aphanothece sacrum FPU1]GBF86536.1 hypothetical protein AsFPU3_3607 [Aphanothece sacrum FPU3]
MLRQLSLARLGLTIGGILTIMGFIAYATDHPTLNLVGFFYGVPVLLGGLALKAAEVKPVPFTELTSPEILKLRQEQATSTQNQIRNDVTRYRYGQQAHLDDSLERLGLSPTDEERPLLIGIKETAIDGNYSLILKFNCPFISLETWEEKQEKIDKFFGPGIYTKIMPLEDNQINIALITLPSSSSKENDKIN